MNKIGIFFLAVQLSLGNGAEEVGAPERLSATTIVPPFSEARTKIDDVSKPLILAALSKIDKSDYIETVFNAITSTLERGFYFYPHHAPYLTNKTEVIKLHDALINAVYTPTPTLHQGWMHVPTCTPETRDAMNAAYYLTQVVMAWNQRPYFIASR